MCTCSSHVVTLQLLLFFTPSRTSFPPFGPKDTSAHVCTCHHRGQNQGARLIDWLAGAATFSNASGWGARGRCCNARKQDGPRQKNPLESRSPLRCCVPRALGRRHLLPDLVQLASSEKIGEDSESIIIITSQYASSDRPLRPPPAAAAQKIIFS